MYLKNIKTSLQGHKGLFLPNLIFSEAEVVYLSNGEVEEAELNFIQ
jgi:hypothetical protein